MGTDESDLGETVQKLEQDLEKTKSDLVAAVQKLSKDVETAYSDCKALSRVEALQYPDLQGLLQIAQRFYPVHRKGVKRALSGHFSKPLKSTELVVSSIEAMISGFKVRLYDNAIGYSQALDAKYNAFYGMMADNLLDNMREKNLRHPPTADPKTELDAKALAGFFAVGAIPKLGDLSAFKRVMEEYDSEYDRIEKEARSIFGATKGTVLELDEANLSITAVMLKYGPLGKMGKMRIDYLRMEMLADKKGLYTDIVGKAMPSLVSS